MVVSGNNDLSGTIPINYDGCVTFPNPFASFMSRMYNMKYAKAILFCPPRIQQDVGHTNNFNIIILHPTCPTYGKHPSNMRLWPSPGRGGGHLQLSKAKYLYSSKPNGFLNKGSNIIRKKKNDHATNDKENEVLKTKIKQNHVFITKLSKKNPEEKIPSDQCPHSYLGTTKIDTQRVVQDMHLRNKPKYKYAVSKKKQKFWRDAIIITKESDKSKNYYSILNESDFDESLDLSSPFQPTNMSPPEGNSDPNMCDVDRDVDSMGDDLYSTNCDDFDMEINDDDNHKKLNSYWMKLKNLVNVLKLKNFAMSKEDGLQAVKKEHDRLIQVLEIREALAKADKKIKQENIEKHQVRGSFDKDFYPDPDEYTRDVIMTNKSSTESENHIDVDQESNETFSVPDEEADELMKPVFDFKTPTKPTNMPYEELPAVITPPDEKKDNDPNHVKGDTTMTTSIPMDQRKAKLVTLIIQHNKDLGRDLSRERIALLNEEPIANLSSIQSAVSKEKYDFIKKQNLTKNTSSPRHVAGQESIMKYVQRPPPLEENVYSYTGEAVTDEGLNVERYTKTIEDKSSCVRDKTKPPPVPVDTLESEKQRTCVQFKQSYTARFRIYVNGIANVGFILKQLFQLWREADRATIFHEFFDESNLNTLIDHENRVPNDEKDLKKYMAGLRESRNNMFFSIRISGEATLRTIKSAVTPWMMKHRSRVDFDMLKAERVCTIGFFTAIHPDYYNRTVFKAALNEILIDNKITSEINVYPRKLWTTHKEEKKTTRALVIEVPIEKREEVTEVLIKQQHEAYQQAEYVPFSNIDDEAYTEMMTTIFHVQNEYLHSRDKKVMHGIYNAQTTYELKDGSFSTFQEWVETITFDDTTFIESCELGTRNTLHVVFEKKNESTVTKLFGSNLREMASESFFDSSLKQIFHPTEFKMAKGRNFSNAEISYAEKLKRKYAQIHQHHQLSNTKGNGPPSKPTSKNLSYSKFSKASDLRLTPYADIVKKESTTITTLQSRLDKLEKEIITTETIPEKNPMQAMSKEEWSQQLEEKFNTKMKILEEKFQTKLETSEQNTRKLIEKSEERMIASFEKNQKAQAEQIDNSIQAQFDDFKAFFARISGANPPSSSQSTAPSNCKMEAVIGGGKYQ